MKEVKLENDELVSLLPEAEARNQSAVNIDNPYSSALLDPVKQELGDTLLKHEPFINDGASYKSQSVPKDIETIMKQKIEEDSKIWRKKDFLETRNNCVLQDMNFDYSDPQKLVKQEIEEFVVKHEPFIKEDTSTEFQGDTEDIKPFTDQIIDENGKIWCREDSAETGSLDSVKDLDSENGLEVEKNLNDVKYENVNWNTHFIRNKNHKLNNETESTEIEIEDVNEMGCFIQKERESKSCDVPTRMDSSNSELMRHECHFCDYSSLRKGGLQSHIKSIHLKLRTHKCHLCDYSSSFKSNLQKHVDSVHLKLKTYKCHLCDYTSSWKGHLQSHIKSVHLKLRKHKCHICDVSSSCIHLQEPIQSNQLKMKGQKCHLCDYSSSFKADLQRHINSVHLKQKNHKCNFCDYSSSFNKDLERHVSSVHLKLKNQKCHLCDHMSSRKEHLQSHINSVHLKLKNHKCHLCDFSCSRNSRLQKHINSIHLKLKTQKCV